MLLACILLAVLLPHDAQGEDPPGRYPGEAIELEGYSSTVLPILPDDKLTPGEVGETSTAKVCVIGYSSTVRHTSDFVKATAYKEYGIAYHKPGEFEVDHRVPLELGGADTLWNLWPESYLTQPWNAHKKDRLENALRRAVCIKHSMTLADAQSVFLGNWITGYQKYVAADPPAAPTSEHRSKTLGR